MQIMTTKKTNKTKQTAVDQILNLLNKEGFAPVLTEEEIKFFKEMEKQQRMSDFTMGITNANRMEATKDAEQWYNETYGGNK
jgi:hypothetical protein